MVQTAQVSRRRRAPRRSTGAWRCPASGVIVGALAFLGTGQLRFMYSVCWPAIRGGHRPTPCHHGIPTRLRAVGRIALGVEAFANRPHFAIGRFAPRWLLTTEIVGDRVHHHRRPCRQRPCACHCFPGTGLEVAQLLQQVNRILASQLGIERAGTVAGGAMAEEAICP